MKKKINITLTIIWMIFIFIMSSFNAQESRNQSGYIVSIIAELLNINNIHTLSFIIRKVVHFGEYFILGILLNNLIHIYNKKTYIAIIICILYSITDELHQFFVPGRSCQLLDIIIDSFGSLSGTYLFFLIKKRHKF